MERFDFNFPPYEYLTGNERANLQSTVDIAFFEDETVIIEANQPVDYLYVVIKGLVREMNAEGEVVGLYHAKDTFEARALVEGQTPHRFIVQEEALVYTLPKATILELMESNPRFGAYFLCVFSRQTLEHGAQQRLTAVREFIHCQGARRLS